MDMQDLRNPTLLIDAHNERRLRGMALRALPQAPEVAQQLLDEIDRADIVAPEALPADVVTLGSFVTYQDETSRAIQTLKLVAPHEADLARMRVSVLSPVGVALLGLSPGQRIACAIGVGPPRALTVLRVWREG